MTLKKRVEFIMNKIIIYTTKICPYCVKAKMLLTKKGASYQEIDASDDAIRAEMINLAGGRKTVPQIFINDQHIGGCDDLYELDETGKLDQLLKQN
jgi:glutaredoxin 3